MEDKTVFSSVYVLKYYSLDSTPWTLTLLLLVLSHCALGRKKGGKGAIFHAFCVVCARARSTVGGKEDLVEAVEAVEAAADFLVLAPGASRVTVLKVKQVIGLKMLLMKTCTFVFLAPGQGWLGRVVGYNLAWAAGTGSAAHC